jgi:predicted ester cyclase
LHKLSRTEKRLHTLAMRVDKRLFGAPLVGIVHAKDFEPMITPPQTILHRWYDEVWNKGRIEAIDEMLDPNVIGHGLFDLNGNEIRRAEDLKAFCKSFRGIFPDIRVIVEDTVSEGDKVVALCTVKATHTGEGLAMSPTNRVVEFTGMCMVRVKDRRIVEAWNSFDFLSMMQQLGLVSLGS